MLFQRLDQHLESNNSLAIEQFGFRKVLNTESTIFILTDNILTSLNQRHQTGGVFFDLTKAFDCVNHDTIFNKLHYYGIRGICHHCFKSNLTNSKQRVNMSSQIVKEENSSSWK